MGWIAEIGFHFFYLFFVLMNPVTSVDEGEFKPEKQNVVLVYGLFGTPTVMQPLKERLEEAGYNVLIPNIGWARGEEIDVFAKLLQEFLERKEKSLMERHEKTLIDLRDSIILFGHSMGGLIILSAQRLDPGLEELRVITAGTPIQGTPLASLIPWDKAGRQMRPDSQWLKNLREHIKNHPRRLVQIRAEADELVPEGSSALNDYPVVIAPFVGHAALIFRIDPAMFRGTQSP